MAQYTVFPTDTAIVEVEDAIGMKFRLWQASGILYLRQTLNASPGFDGDENVDWMTIEEYVLPVSAGALHRVGVRDGHWVIDQTYTPDILQFAGDEGVDWDAIETHQL